MIEAIKQVKYMIVLTFNGKPDANVIIIKIEEIKSKLFLILFKIDIFNKILP